MSRTLLLAAICALCCPAVAVAQDGGPADGGLVDGGTVGQGGADRDNEEGEDTTGRVPTRCDRATDCAAGFSCVDGRCRWRGVREAEGGFGCGGAGAAMLLAPGLVVVALRRRRRS